jgi:ribosomal protein L24E
MSSTKDCPGCGRGFLKGKKVLFPLKDGRLVRKLVCLTCSAKCERIMTRVTAKPCMVAACDNAAHLCTTHAAEMVLSERRSCTTGLITELRGMAAALKVTERTHGGEDFIQGKIEGIEAVLEVLSRQAKMPKAKS